jgi:hypothetical protein
LYTSVSLGLLCVTGLLTVSLGLLSSYWLLSFYCFALVSLVCFRLTGCFCFTVLL